MFGFPHALISPLTGSKERILIKLVDLIPIPQSFLSFSCAESVIRLNNASAFSHLNELK